QPGSVVAAPHSAVALSHFDDRIAGLVVDGMVDSHGDLRVSRVYHAVAWGLDGAPLPRVHELPWRSASRARRLRSAPRTRRAGATPCHASGPRAALAAPAAA